MERIGIGDLRRHAGAILRRVTTGETIEITDRGQPVAVLLGLMPHGLARLEREGLLRRAVADILDLKLVSLPPGSPESTKLVADARTD